MWLDKSLGNWLELKRRNPNRGRQLVALGAIFLCLLLIVAGAGAVWQDHSFSERAKSTTAVVTAHIPDPSPTRCGNCMPSQRLVPKVSFIDGNSRHRHGAFCSQSLELDTYPVGREVEIRYDPDDPVCVRLPKAGVSVGWTFLILGCLLGVLLGFGYVSWVVRGTKCEAASQ